MFLISKSITCFVNGSTSGMKSQSIIYLLSGSPHIYWILDLEVKCTQYGICSQAAFKNARAIFFFQVGWGMHHVSVGYKNFSKGLSNPDMIPRKFVRGCLMSAHVNF